MISTKLSADQALVIKFWRAKSTKDYLSIRVTTGYNFWLWLWIYINTFRITVDGNRADQLGNGMLRNL